MIGKLMYGPCAVALASATVALAQPSQGGATGDANRVICRNMAETGSRLGHTRACHTAREWADLRRQTRENVDRIQTRQSMNADPSG
jgi:hypothetical protein